ncbi:MAG: EAL domain-containing protein [Methyloceanibacter sp.]|nr:EAL domain-containing protein [Methyloceanibacter sp.]
MLNLIVLVAMAVTAAAFGAGMTMQAGLPWLPVLIGSLALFLVMATTFLRGGRGGGGGGGDRLDDLEQALEVIDIDLQRLDRVEDGMARLQALHDKVERLDQHVASGSGGGDGLSADLQQVYDRIETVRAEVTNESRAQRQKIINDLGALETLIAQMVGRAPGAAVAAAPAMAVAAADAEAEVERKSTPLFDPEPLGVEEPELVFEPEPEPVSVVEAEPEPVAEPEPEPVIEPEPEQIDEPEPEEPDLVLEEEIELEPIEAEAGQEDEGRASEAVLDETDSGDDREVGREEAILAAALAAAQPEPEPEPEPELPAEAEPEEGLELEEETLEEVAYDFADEDDDAMLEVIREGIEQGRVDVYLQPTVTLPGRKVRYFEGLTRIRKSGGEIVMPGDYMPVAKRSALMPLIDNVLVVRAVQVLRRLGPDAPIEGVFANISMHSLLDTDYFPELIEFMEENAGLSDRLVFEINQAEMQGLSETELGCLDTLGALGFGFCIDNVVDLEAGFDGLGDRHFRFAKVSAAEFLGGPGRHAADLKRRLDGADIQLIIEKVEKEGDVARLLDHGIELAQGHLFAEPAPMNAALSRELSGAS